MTQRKPPADGVDLESAGRTFGNKKYDSVRINEDECNRMYEQMELKQQDRFISRADQLCRCLFLISFIAMATAVANGVYRPIGAANSHPILNQFSSKHLFFLPPFYKFAK